MSYAAVEDEAEDRYYTQVDAGDVRLFTLDQLDAAFNAGLIHENTYVCLEGDSSWVTLGEVAGLGEEEPISAQVPVAAPAAQSHVVAAPAYSASAPPSAISAAPYSVAPMVMPRSIAPVVNDLSFDDDMDMLALRPKRRLGKVIAAVAVLALGGLGFAVVQSGGLRLPKVALGEGVAQASAASLTLSSLKDSQPSPAPQAAPEPPRAEEPKQAELSEAEQAAKKTDDRFSEEMKAALLNKDKQQAQSQKSKATRTAVGGKQRRPGGKSSKGGAGLKAGGSAYDPLNGKL